MKVDVILPAGGRISGEFAAEVGTEVKALIEIDGSTVLERTLSTLRSWEQTGRIVVIGPSGLQGHPACREADAVLLEGKTGPENIFRGIEWLDHESQDADRVLILTTDLPFLSADVLSRFFDACPDASDIALPLIRREEFEGHYPGSRNMYVRLQDGEWTMGCAFLVNPSALLGSREVIESVFEARKSQFGMARLLGLSFIFRFLTGRLTIPQIEKRCLDILGCSGGVVLGCSPHLAFDIDSHDEYRYAINHVGDSNG